MMSPDTYSTRALFLLLKWYTTLVKWSTTPQQRAHNDARVSRIRDEIEHRLNQDKEDASQ